MKKKTRLDTTRKDLQHLRPFQERIGELYKYFQLDMNGCYYLQHLPYSGGLLEQDWEFVDDVETILHCLNRKK